MSVLVQLPPNVTMDAKAEKVHGISSFRDCQTYGVAPRQAAQLLDDDMAQQRADILVAHNLPMDAKVIMEAIIYRLFGIKRDYTTLRRGNTNSINDRNNNAKQTQHERICTMRMCAPLSLQQASLAFGNDDEKSSWWHSSLAHNTTRCGNNHHGNHFLTLKRFDALLPLAVVMTILLLLPIGEAFYLAPTISTFAATIRSFQPGLPPVGHTSSTTKQCLLPLTSFLSEDLTFLSQKNFDKDSDESIDFYIPEEDDLPEVSTFIVQSFGADAINLSQDFNTVEQIILQPVAGFLNGYSGMAAYTEVLTGLRQRLKTRLQQQQQGQQGQFVIDAPQLEGLTHQEQIQAASRGALVFVLAKPKSKESNDSGYDILASVELRLELTDGKIPFSLPWLDRFERRVASLIGWSNSKDDQRSIELQPYLSSLCVDESYRKRGFGRALVHCCEDVARNCWGYDRLYLHVDPDNTPAVKLYASEGYKEVNGVRWNPFWAGPASEIGYYVKELL